MWGHRKVGLAWTEPKTQIHTGVKVQLDIDNSNSAKTFTAVTCKHGFSVSRLFRSINAPLLSRVQRSDRIERRVSTKNSQIPLPLEPIGLVKPSVNVTTRHPPRRTASAFDSRGSLRPRRLVRPLPPSRSALPALQVRSTRLGRFAEYPPGVLVRFVRVSQAPKANSTSAECLTRLDMTSIRLGLKEEPNPLHDPKPSRRRGSGGNPPSWE